MPRVADIVSIVVFVAIGRRNHDEGEAVDGILTVAAPFLIALVVGWIVARAWTRPMQVETAFIIWPVTVAVGMVLRNLVFDRGTALPFIIVATLVTRRVPGRLADGGRHGERSPGHGLISRGR